MILDRVALSDIVGPRLLARTLHQQIGALPGAVPVVEIASALDIAEIRQERFDGFEGMLLTDTVRSRGAILANTKGGRRRARFTIAHELGHFLLERHDLTSAEGFRCRATDLREGREDTRRRLQETQANQFAAEFLCPTHIANGMMSDDPDLRDAERLRDKFDVSLEAAVRQMIDLRPEHLAAVWSHEGQVRYICKSRAFPFVTCRPKTPLPQEAPAALAIARRDVRLTPFHASPPHAWADRLGIAVREQARVGTNRHAVTLLCLEEPDHDPDEAYDDLLPELGAPRFR